MSATLQRRSCNTSDKTVARNRRHFRLRKKISGTAERPRLVVSRSLRNITAQLVDDTKGHTLVAASTLDPALRSIEGDKKARASAVGRLVAERAKEVGIQMVTFDRGGNKYHGRIAALANAAREGGLEF